MTAAKNLDKPSSDWVVIDTSLDYDDDGELKDRGSTPRACLMLVWADLTDEEKARQYSFYPAATNDSPHTLIGLEPWGGRARLFASHAEAGAAYRAEWGTLSKPWKIVRLTNRESLIARSNPDDFPDGYWDDYDTTYIGPGAAVEKLADTEIEAEVELTHDEAKTLTDRIKVQAENLWADITKAYQRRAWAALGYKTWDAYTTAEFGTLRLRLPREERQEVVCSLRESGMPIRAIASATGADPKTVQADLKSTVGNSHTSPTTVTGLDGKQHPASKPEPDPDARIVPRGPRCFKDTWDEAYTLVGNWMETLLRNPTYAQAEKIEKRLRKALRKIEGIKAEIEEAEQSRRETA